jgi:hypothetical protein
MGNNSLLALPSGRMAGMELLVLPLVDSKSFLSQLCSLVKQFNSQFAGDYL